MYWGGLYDATIGAVRGVGLFSQGNCDRWLAILSISWSASFSWYRLGINTRLPETMRSTAAFSRPRHGGISRITVCASLSRKGKILNFALCGSLSGDRLASSLLCAIKITALFSSNSAQSIGSQSFWSSILRFNPRISLSLGRGFIIVPFSP